MLSKKAILRICLVLAIISWSVLLIYDLVSIIGIHNKLDLNLPFYVKASLFSLYCLAIFYFFKLKLEEGENVNFLELQWRAFISGLIASLIALMVRFSDVLFPNAKMMENLYIANLLYHILLALVVIFLVITFIAWKQLILYQKSSILLRIWNIFEYSLLLSLLLNFLPLNYLDYRFYTPFFFINILGLILSVNLKWVAFINFRQKWQSILLILLTLLSLLFVLSALSDFNNHAALVIDITTSIFVLVLFAFAIIYAFFSILVILFNLPTSSVFEQKMEEVINFQRLSQSLQLGQKEDYAYDVLLNSSTSSASAEACWLEINDGNGNIKSLIKRNISTQQIIDIKQGLKGSNLGYVLQTPSHRSINKNKLHKDYKKLPFNSILVIPILVKGRNMGLLVLIKSLKDGFTKEMVDIINAFVNQAVIFIENSRLITEAIRNERYKEELTIARKVQKSLLPSDINQSEHYTVSSFTEAAEEVGGDYYDIYKYSENKTAFIIGDVSGKGTTAAFHMAQLKGVFHSLVQLDLSSEQFLIHANRALSRCLEKTTFITLTFFIVDLQQHKIQLTRAGHCPALFYDSITEKVYFLNTKGLGLGIIRNSKFDSYNDVIEFSYNAGDIILLYTDGIVEAKDLDNEEYGYERLKSLLELNPDLTAQELNEKVIEDLYNFCGTKKLDDDYTLVIIKFN